ncbi:MAG: NUDIX domain-containing protein [Ginsengibacter sp.]
MTKKQSAGILVYRKKGNELEVFLVHPGGPFWKKKDVGAWSIPKGEFSDDENSLDAAKREFFEETGFNISGNFIELQPVKLKSGKIVFAWAVEGDIDADNIESNLFEIEWPPRSGKMQLFPEVDSAEWFTVEEAKKKMNVMQVEFLQELVQILAKR